MDRASHPLPHPRLATEAAPGDGFDSRAVVEQLRLIRTVSQQRRYAGRALPRLPSRRVIAEIADDLVALLYPRHFGPEGLDRDQTDDFVARTIRSVAARLSEQVRHELILTEDPGEAAARDRAAAAVRGFLADLPRLRDLHDTDIAAAYDGDPSARSLDEIVASFPGIAAILRHRLAHELYLRDAPMLARIMAELSHSRTAIDIHPGARVGPACFIDHGTGVVIGETAVIGRNVRLYQQVTLGARRFEMDGTGALVKGLPRHPVIEDDVVIYAGATILGRVTVGRGSVIGGGVWLTRDVPPGTIVTQANADHRPAQV